jgi:hypothetical protein
MKPVHAGRQDILQAGTYRGLHWVITMLQTKILLFCHTQMGICHIQKRLASILFLDKKKRKKEKKKPTSLISFC